MNLILPLFLFFGVFCALCEFSDALVNTRTNRYDPRRSRLQAMRKPLARSSLRARRPFTGSRRGSQLRLLSRRRGGMNTATSIKNTKNEATKHIKQTIIIAKTANIMSPIGTQNNDKTAISNRGSGGVQNSSPPRNVEISSTRQRALVARKRRPYRRNHSQISSAVPRNGRRSNFNAGLGNSARGLSSPGRRVSNNIGIGNGHSGSSRISGNNGRHFGTIDRHGGSFGGHENLIGGGHGDQLGQGTPLAGNEGSSTGSLGHGGSLGGIGDSFSHGGSLSGNRDSLSRGGSRGHDGSMGGNGVAMIAHGISVGGHGVSGSTNGGSLGSHSGNTGGHGEGFTSGVAIHRGEHIPNNPSRNNFRPVQNNFGQSGSNSNFNIADMLLSGLGVASSSPNLLALMSSGTLNVGGEGINRGVAPEGAGLPDLTGLFRGKDGAMLLNNLVQNIMGSSGSSAGGMGVTAPSVVTGPTLSSKHDSGISGSAHEGKTVTGGSHTPIIIEAGSNVQVGFRHTNGAPNIVIKSAPTTTPPSTFLASGTAMALPSLGMEPGEELP
ncbi:uncharacterized transmembrane protein DDB_G0289901-like [Ylistrum balloti]|uniref:uncharacterized transmembrane protein DDB_G0289901-like n=1 Tax=Ylistrum balloti TaxID=509963 RepID=UPI002905845A|nr:uncharacterized transmembrane protein DDB_G0289901-like [Ylistrum balloti]